MPDSVTFQSVTPATPPDGTKIATDDAGAVGQVQIVKLAQSADGSATPITADSDGVLVNLGANNDVTVASLPLPSGAATATKQDTGNTALAAIQAAAEILDDWDESDRAKVNPIAGQVGVQGASGVVTALTQRVVLATDVALPAGANAIGKLLPPDIDVTTHANYIKKYYTNAGAVTDGIIWSPASGKRWHVVSMYINVSAAAILTLEDDKAGGDEVVWKGEYAANSGVTIYFGEKYPLASGEDAADLMVTTSTGNVYITVTGYEI